MKSHQKTLLYPQPPCRPNNCGTRTTRVSPFVENEWDITDCLLECNFCQQRGRVCRVEAGTRNQTCQVCKARKTRCVYPPGYKARGQRAHSPARGGAGSSVEVSADELAELQGEVEDLRERLEWAVADLNEAKGEIAMLRGGLQFEMAYRVRMGRVLAKRVNGVERFVNGDSADDASSDVGNYDVELNDVNWDRGLEEYEATMEVWKEELEEREREDMRKAFGSGLLESGDRAEYRPSSDDDEMDVDGRVEVESSVRKPSEGESASEEEDEREVEAASRAAEIRRAAAEFVAATKVPSAAEDSPDEYDDEEWGGIVEEEVAVVKTAAEIKREKNKAKKERQKANRKAKELGRRR